MILRVRRLHRAELEQMSGAPALAGQQDYLETLIDLSERKAVSRVMYLVEAGAGATP